MLFPIVHDIVYSTFLVKRVNWGLCNAEIELHFYWPSFTVVYICGDLWLFISLLKEVSPPQSQQLSDSNWHKKVLPLVRRMAVLVNWSLAYTLVFMTYLWWSISFPTCIVGKLPTVQDLQLSTRSGYIRAHNNNYNGLLPLLLVYCTSNWYIVPYQ